MGYSRLGIDVSELNGFIDWGKVKAQNKARFAIIRCGYGGNYENQDDSQFINNISGCEKNKIPYGIYLYSYATNREMIGSEVEHIKKLLDYCIYGNWFRMGVWLDIEEQSQFNLGSKMNDLVNYFIEQMGEIKHNRRIGIYTNPSFLNNCFNSISEKIPLWVACWNNEKPTGYKYDKMIMWQKGSMYNFSGINGLVDYNYSYVSIYHDYQYNSKRSVKITKSLNDLAYEVIEGKWGTASERKEKLTNAGYDYNKVQDLVNDILALQGVYKVKVTAISGLCCRTNPNTNSDIVCVYPYRETVTVYEKNSGWGKTEKGWINLVWTEKIN